MSTPCRIGYYNRETQTVISVSCNFDGYPDHAGRMLLDHYNSVYDLEALLEQGNMSSIAPCVVLPDNVMDADDYDENETCIFYGRDYGQTGQDAQVFMCEFCGEMYDMFEEWKYDVRIDEFWFYVFDGKEWHVAEHNDPNWIPLRQHSELQ